MTVEPWRGVRRVPRTSQNSQPWGTHVLPVKSDPFRVYTVGHSPRLSGRVPGTKKVLRGLSLQFRRVNDVQKYLKIVYLEVPDI